MSKAVTIMGFSSTRNGPVPPVGEIWAMNECYRVFDLPVMEKVTRIYQMHKWARISQSVTGNKPDVWHLDYWGKKGIRIIMQDKHEEITNSETYPLYEIEGYFEDRMWSGTAHYMIAQAIKEGYKHIRILGLELSDFKHFYQQIAQAWWLSCAKRKGVAISGDLGFITDDHSKRYGYDNDTPWDDWENERLFKAFPFELKIKDNCKFVKLSDEQLKMFDKGQISLGNPLDCRK